MSRAARIASTEISPGPEKGPDRIDLRKERTAVVDCEFDGGTTTLASVSAVDPGVEPLQARPQRGERAFCPSGYSTQKGEGRMISTEFTWPGSRCGAVPSRKILTAEQESSNNRKARERVLN